MLRTPADVPDRCRPCPSPALQVSPICPEAHNVLALCSDSLEAALERYRKAEEVGMQVSDARASLHGASPLSPRGGQQARAQPAGCAARGRLGLVTEQRGRYGQGPSWPASRQPPSPKGRSGSALTAAPAPWPHAAQVCPPELLPQELKNGELWLRVCARPYLRCAVTLSTYACPSTPPGVPIGSLRATKAAQGVIFPLVTRVS